MGVQQLAGKWFGKGFKRAALVLALAGGVVCGGAAAAESNRGWGLRGVTAAGSASAAAPALEQTDRLIVKYRSRTGATTLDAAALTSARVAGNRAGVQISHLRRTDLGAHVLRVNRRLSLAVMRQMAADLKAGDSDVEYAEPDRLAQIQMTPTDPAYILQWSYSEATAGLNLPAAWDKSTGAGVVVAVIDTGYRPHSDLAANLLPGYDFITDLVVANDGSARDADASDPGDAAAAGECGTGSAATVSSWHGTHVAGTLAAVAGNSMGGVGVAFGAKVLPLRVLGKCGGYTSDIADAIVWASGGAVTGVPANPTPARVINLSLSGAGACDVTTQTAINSARSRNTVLVVAAGNANSDAVNFFPANCAGVITVGAVGRSGARAYYSNYGSNVDVSAPGGDMSINLVDGVFSTLDAGSSTPVGDSYGFYQGTSMAAPHVAGVVALMLARNPALTPDEVETRLKASVRPLPQLCTLGCGSGLVDANLAVDAALASTPVTAPAPIVAQLTEIEPNDSRTSAQLLSANPVNVKGSIASSRDTDYYKVGIQPGRTLVARLTPNATSNYDLVAYDASGRLIASSSKGTGQIDQVSLSNSGSSASLVYLRVTRISGGTGSAAGVYSMALAQ
jgi:serine protease